MTRPATKPFVIGQRYFTNDGRVVMCVDIDRECAQFDDAEIAPYSRGGYFHRDTGAWIQQTWHEETTGWRYNRDADRGRSTGSAFDHSDPNCVIPEPA